MSLLPLSRLPPLVERVDAETGEVACDPFLAQLMQGARYGIIPAESVEDLLATALASEDRTMAVAKKVTATKAHAAGISGGVAGAVAAIIVWAWPQTAEIQSAIIILLPAAAAWLGTWRSPANREV